MKITKRGEYALRAMTMMAMNSEKGLSVTLIDDLARQEKIPPRYLEHILLNLKNAGLLTSKRGVGGGYALNRKASDISLGEMLRAVEGSETPLSAGKKGMKAGRGTIAPGLYSVLEEVGEAIARLLDDVSLADITKRTNELIEKEMSVPSYVI